MSDPVRLTADLIRCASVTPQDAGALPLLEGILQEAGFRTERIERNGIDNLFARWGESGPVLGFNGHTDVVPPGDVAAWTHPPFAAEIVDDVLYGRGACDMKSGVAAFVAAAIGHVQSAPETGSIILTITGDEEGDGVDGTRAILDWMAQNGQRMDHCIVGEPTCPAIMGEMIKIGRRGSMTAYFTARGIQGHSAYPHRAKNPLPALVRLMDRLASTELDRGQSNFDPSTLALTTIDVGNPANNVIPAEARATLNIRFNTAHSSETLQAWIDNQIARIAEETDIDIDVTYKVSGESFLTEPSPFTDLVAHSVAQETGITPEHSTSGGTSDARFIRDHCPVVEVGLVGQTMHQIDECVEIPHIRQLTAIYRRILDAYFTTKL